ncbi:Cytochrome oxidase Cu insertion factor (SCO1/SenC/PrrC family) [Vibrio crassostreae]|nr:Cytochrome oxidase Cu insertion factor (SCO1/SenC/PrrC family) [Vibrio crassostreae]CAK2349271.1 Cytochrome oxidase Cu insertion factor (SCO1/SenC/PrrC family) [Vibrio crassostreae]CAK2523375.1 Cytochrome oxidase Cu insertion factor (SCO1/SenC/PrrC family) [Vibrio crassostreae]CAK2982652.1 Cytochrome oxidase Cu insertion factor (SCO1/SenC/PrrC family) [Vibrio crassostreae]
MNKSQVQMNKESTDANLAAFKQRRSRGRLVLIGLILIFALPAIIAKTVLDQNWYTSGVTNSGELVEPRTTLADFGVTVPMAGEGWLMGYIAPVECESLCEQQLHYLNQSYLALGKNKERVTAVVFVSEGNSLSGSLDKPDLSLLTGGDQLSTEFAPASIVIIDPLGQLVMEYKSVSDPSQLVGQSKGMIHDLRKLLKLSRVG